MGNWNVPLWYCHNFSTLSKCFAFPLKTTQYLVHNDAFPQSVSVKYSFQQINPEPASFLPASNYLVGSGGGFVPDTEEVTSPPQHPQTEWFCHMKEYQPHDLTLESVAVSSLDMQRWSGSKGSEIVSRADYSTFCREVIVFRAFEHPVISATDFACSQLATIKL